MAGAALGCWKSALTSDSLSVIVHQTKQGGATGAIKDHQIAPAPPSPARARPSSPRPVASPPCLREVHRNMRNATPSRSRTTGPARRERGEAMAVVRESGSEPASCETARQPQCFQWFWPTTKWCDARRPINHLRDDFRLLFAGGPPVRAQSKLTAYSAQPLRDLHTGNLRTSFITEPAARSRSADSESGGDV